MRKMSRPAISYFYHLFQQDTCPLKYINLEIFIKNCITIIHIDLIYLIETRFYVRVFMSSLLFPCTGANQSQFVTHGERRLRNSCWSLYAMERQRDLFNLSARMGRSLITRGTRDFCELTGRGCSENLVLGEIERSIFATDSERFYSMVFIFIFIFIFIVRLMGLLQILAYILVPQIFKLELYFLF